MSDVPVSNESGAAAIGVSKHSTLLGFLLILLGFLAMGSPVLTGVIFASILGLFLIVAGVSRILHSLKTPTFGRGLLFVLWGVLSICCGIFMFMEPLFSLAIAT